MGAQPWEHALARVGRSNPGDDPGAWPRAADRVRSTAMTDVPTSVDSLGLVDRVAALHRVELFACIPGRLLAAVAELTSEVRSSPGDMLIEEGAVEAHLYAIVQGRVR